MAPSFRVGSRGPFVPERTRPNATITTGMRTRDDDGFTLIELLVVVAIIGVLASIAIPVLFGQRGKAYRSAMASDLHAVITAETAWLTEYDGYTGDPADLTAKGYRPSNGVTTHIALSGNDFVACTQHAGLGDWLVYDSTTSSYTTSASDCG